MPNGSVASRLKDHVHGQPVLDWSRRKRIALGQKAMDFGGEASQKGVMLDLVKKLHHEEKLNQLIDKDLKQNFDRVELEQMVQVALLCAQFNPSHRPKMSEVLSMLGGDDVAEKWKPLRNPKH
ncbi:hypothetical protein Droror1_Dr00018614 [Drosera rotundifolia]